MYDICILYMSMYSNIRYDSIQTHAQNARVIRPFLEVGYPLKFKMVMGNAVHLQMIFAFEHLHSLGGFPSRV